MKKNHGNQFFYSSLKNLVKTYILETDILKLSGKWVTNNKDESGCYLKTQVTITII